MLDIISYFILIIILAITSHSAHTSQAPGSQALGEHANKKTNRGTNHVKGITTRHAGQGHIKGPLPHHLRPSVSLHHVIRRNVHFESKG
jgi:hypothetical protein